MRSGRQPGPRAPRGQGMTEYVIVVALVAVAAIGVVTVFGNNIRELFGASASALAGVETRVDTKAPGDDVRGKKTLKDFTEGSTGY